MYWGAKARPSEQHVAFERVARSRSAPLGRSGGGDLGRRWGGLGGVVGGLGWLLGRMYWGAKARPSEQHVAFERVARSRSAPLGRSGGGDLGRRWGGLDGVVGGFTYLYFQSYD